MTRERNWEKWRYVMGNKLWDVGEKTEKIGACYGPGLRCKWRLKALTGQSGEPGMHGKGIDKERCWYWIVLDVLICSDAPWGENSKSARKGTLVEMRSATSGTKLDFRKKVKKATRNQAHMAACKGIAKVKCEMKCGMKCEMWNASTPAAKFLQ